MRVRLPHDETDERKRYTLPDPDVLAAAVDLLHGEVFPLGGPTPERIEVSRAELASVLMLAGGYLDLTRMRNATAAEKLRDLARARAARRASEASHG